MRWLWITCFAALFVHAGPASARMVVILFDTSGSMAPNNQLPSFGARIIAATLDGRQGEDRILALNFDDYAGRYGRPMPSNRQQAIYLFPDPSIIDDVARPIGVLERSITNTGDHQQLLRDLEPMFTATDGVGTPYGPIEVMLDRVADELEASGDQEEVVFVVVTDGQYAEGYDPETGRQINFDRQLAPVLREHMETYRDRIEAAGGSLRTEFLFINVGQQDLEGIVERQGVRRTLLEVFEGQSHPIRNGSELWTALREITASVAGTDLEAQEALISYQGNTIEIDSPLSITRLVVVSTGQVGTALPRRVSDTFGTAPTNSRVLATQMARRDSDYGPIQLQGAVEHLWYLDPIPGGERYSVTFDAPVDENVFLLFETAATIGLRIYDEDGNEMPPEADGSVTLFQGRSYRFESQILDGPGGTDVVDLGALPDSLTMSLSLTGVPGFGTRSMQVERDRDLGSFQWEPQAIGQAVATSRALAGIFSPQSPGLTLNVIDPSVDIVVGTLQSDEPCPSCGAGEVSSPLTNDDQDVLVGTFPVTANGAFDGAIQLNPLPNGFEYRDEDGNVISSDQDIPFGASETQIFSIWRAPDVDFDTLAEGAVDLPLVVTPIDPWSGTPVEQESVVVIEFSNVSIALVTPTQPLDDGSADGLLVPGSELLLGNFAAQFSIVDNIEALTEENIPDRVSAVSNRFTDRLVDFLLFAPPGSHSFNIRPETRFWCLCALWAHNGILGSAQRTVGVSYVLPHPVRDDPMQSASVNVPMEFPVERTQGMLSCLFNLAMIVAAYVIVRGVVALITTYRFERGARLEIVEPGDRARFVRLDKGNSVWWRAWFSFLTGNPDEVRTVEGLRLRATKSGAILDISRATPNWTLDRLGQTFAEIQETQPRKKEFKILWDDRFESIVPPGRALFLRKGRPRN